MNPHIRRAHLGLAISGPFSRNRRRRRNWRNALPYALTAAIAMSILCYLIALFQTP